MSQKPHDLFANRNKPTSSKMDGTNSKPCQDQICWAECECHLNFVCAQPYSTTLSGVPFPLPKPQGIGMIGNSGTCPRPRFEGCARQHSGQEATSANLFREGVLGLQRGPRAKLPRQSNSIFRDDCHLPAMIRLTEAVTPSAIVSAEALRA
jgi:hypothetical protein